MIIEQELEEYLNKNILILYKDNIGGHGISHIKQVVERCFEIIEEFKLDVSFDIILTIAIYHDLGYKIDPDNHELVSAELFYNDEFMKNYFDSETLKIIYEAIIDHRASLEYDPRSIYGKIISSADREISVENMLIRSYFYQKDKHKEENLSEDEIVEYSYLKLSSKYGKSGYAKMYFPDKKYLSFQTKMQELIENKEKFFETEKELVKKKIG